MRARFVPLGLLLAVWGAAARADAPPPEAAAPPPAPEDVKPPRPPLPPPPPRAKLSWERHVDVGIDLAFIERPASKDLDGNPSGIRYDPAPGYGLHARINALRYLRFGAYIVAAHHDVSLPPGAFGYAGPIVLPSVQSYSLGGRIAPTLPFGSRARAWVTAGIGWGRLEVAKMNVTDGSTNFVVRDRAASFVEYPLGMGASFDVLPDRLAVEVETTGAFHTGQEGEALHQAQAIDNLGHIRRVGGFPMLDASFIQTLGVSLVL